jgi:uncharacterized protein with von Willebrand factor type A (vWA) domain
MSLMEFVGRVREAGIAAPADRVRTLIEALDLLGPQQLYWAGRITLCAGRQEIELYDHLFAPAPPEKPKRRVTFAPAAIQGLEASSGEVLRHRDYAALTEAERAEARRMLAQLAPAAPTRRSRRRRPHSRGGIDSRRTMRGMLAALGEPAQLKRNRRTVKLRRVVFLLDISGSMSPYADALLRLAHAAVRHRPATTEVFTIGTRLTRITSALHRVDVDRAVQQAGESVPDWRGGTRLGEALTAFLKRFGHRGMARRAVVVICSDGWECGDASELGAAMAWLARLADRIIWVTPHAARAGFAPRTEGLVKARPYITELVAGHSVDALARVLKGR